MDATYVRRSKAARFATVWECWSLDSSPEQAFDDLASVAGQICNAPVAARTPGARFESAVEPADALRP
jgi:hypothetical protein